MADSMLKGVLHWHIEQGTEGGYFGFYDDAFREPNTTRFACKTCGFYWDKSEETRQQMRARAVECGLASCKHSFEPVSPENWSYEGLHILVQGDYLTIFAKDDPSYVTWKGKIALKEYGPVAYHDGVFYAYYNQIGVDREVWKQWFIDQLPAVLQRS